MFPVLRGTMILHDYINTIIIMEEKIINFTGGRKTPILPVQVLLVYNACSIHGTMTIITYHINIVVVLKLSTLYHTKNPNFVDDLVPNNIYLLFSIHNIGNRTNHFTVTLQP